MIVVGLTGSLAMGKTETGKLFAERGIPVFDSDAAVHALYARGGEAVAAVDSRFPGVAAGGAVDRERLSRRLAAEPAGFVDLEAIVHPLVRKRQDDFLTRCRKNGHAVAVLDIPLLYETGAENRLDKVVVVTAPPDVQRGRALERPGMTEAKLTRILARQIPDAEKRRRADFIVDTSRGLDRAREQVRAIVAAL